jgi:ABC-type lipoprotein release transport system permease subunit
MGWLRAAFWLLPRRLRSAWALLSVSAFGVLAAVVLMAVGAMYSHALAEGGLQHTLASTAPSVLNAQVISQNRPLGPADYDNLRATVEQISQERLGFLIRDIQRHGRTQSNLALTRTLVDQPPGIDSPLGRPFFMTDFAQHTTLLEGRWPETAPVLHEQGVDLEAVIGDRVATTMGWGPGTQVFLLPFHSTPRERLAVTVVGVVTPTDPDEEYWMGYPFHLNVQNFGDTPLFPFYVPESIFFDSIGTRYPTLVGDFSWFLYLETTVLTASDVDPTRDAVLALESDINKQFPRSLVLTGLKPTLAEYRRDLSLARVPLFLFISLVVVVILYFLALVMGLLARTRNDEASLLRSRGASLAQVAGILALAEAIIVVAATIAGPFLAWLLVRFWLLRTIDPVGGVDAVTVGLSADMFILGAVGGLLGLVVLVSSGLNLARLGVVEFLRQRARPPTVPLVHRYYLDFLVLAVLGLLLWQAQARGGLFQRALSGRELDLDPTILVGPALALLAAAFLMLRVLPYLVRLAAWVSQRLAPAWMTFTLARLARDPLPYTSLTVIVMLAAALGVFGSAFQSTLSRSEREQALYERGGDLVVTRMTISRAMQKERFRELVGIEGVEAVSPVNRGQVRLLDWLPNTATTVLAVDPVTLPEATWFREDFSATGDDLSELLSPLRRGRTGLPDLSGNLASGVPIPEEATGIGLWVRAEVTGDGPALHSSNLWMRVVDSRGFYRNVDLGTLPLEGAGPDGGWKFLDSSLPLDSNVLEPPFSIVSIFISGRTFSRMPPGTISLDDITATGGSIPAPGRVIEEFEEPGLWVSLVHDGDEADTAEQGSQSARSGQQGLSFSWVDTLGDTPRGVIVPPGPLPLPAIGSRHFQQGQVVRFRTGRQYVPVVIHHIAEYFPTLHPSRRPFLLVSLEGYGAYLGRIPEGVLDRTEEFWFALDGVRDRQETIADLRAELPRFASIDDRAEAVDHARRNPLAGGGWDSLTLLSIVALALAVVLALGTHAAVAVRSGRVELTVARALGFSRWQMLMSLVLERLVVALVGMVVGAVMGTALAWWTLGFLDRSSSGREIVPPMLITTEQGIIALTVISLVVAAALAIILAAVQVGRLKPSDILRTGG